MLIWNQEEEASDLKGETEKLDKKKIGDMEMDKTGTPSLLNFGEQYGKECV